MFALAILSFMGHSHFGAIVLPGMSACVPKHAYFSGLYSSLFVAWLMMSNEDMLPKLVEGYAQAGLPFVLYVIVGGGFLRYVVIKACFASLVDNFEHDASQKIQYQMLKRDMMERTGAQKKREAVVRDNIQCCAHFAFSDYQYSKNSGGQGAGSTTVGAHADAHENPLQTCCAFFAPHLSDQGGHRVHVELAANGVISVYRSSLMSRCLHHVLPFLFPDSDELELQIPVGGSVLLVQSPFRAKNVYQPSPFVLGIRPNYMNPSLRLYKDVFAETLFYFRSRQVLEQWIDSLVELGADGRERGAILTASLRMQHTTWWKSESEHHHESAIAALSVFTSEDTRNVSSSARSKTERKDLISCFPYSIHICSKLRRTLRRFAFSSDDAHLKANPKPKHNLLRQFFESKVYEATSLIVVVFCVVVTVLDPPVTEPLIPLSIREVFVSQLCFVVIFSVEFLLKLWAHGFRETVTNKWEIIHLFVTISMIAELVVCHIHRRQREREREREREGGREGESARERASEYLCVRERKRMREREMGREREGQ